MPQKFFILESEDEVHAKHVGFAGGIEVGYKKGFMTASTVWLILFVIYLFLTIQNINYLTEIRIKISEQLKAKLPAQSDYIDIIIPDGSLDSLIQRRIQNNSINLDSQI